MTNTAATHTPTAHQVEEARHFAEMARGMHREAERCEARQNTGAAFTARCEATHFERVAAEFMNGERG